MKKIIKVLVIILVVGIVLGGIGFLVIGGKDGLKNLTQPIERFANTVTENNTVTSLVLNLSSDEVTFVKAEDNKLKIDYYDYEDNPYIYSFINGCATLTAPNLSPKNWLKIFRINLDKDDYEMTVYLPESVIDEIKIELSSGDVNIKNCGINVDKLNIAISSGNANIADVTANTAKCKASSGDINIEKSYIKDIDGDASSGDITLQTVEADRFSAHTSSGCINIVSCEITIVDVDISSGDFKADKLIANTIESDLSSGNTELSLVGTYEEYKVTARISSGNINLKDNIGNTLVRTEDDLTYGNGSKTVDTKASSGNIDIVFLG